jgi:hypothetical protein
MYAFIKKLNYQVLIFFTIVLIKSVFIAMLPGLTMTTGADEVGTIAGAAFFAGLDWSYVISTAPYYGFGYTMLMAPLFLLGLSPQLIFHVMLFCGAVLLGFCGVICYNILTRFFDIADKRFCYLLTVTAIFFINNNISTNWVYNEAILFLLGWLIIYILLIMYRRKQDGKNNYIYSTLLALIMCYGILCHARILFYWGAIAVFLVCHYVITRKRLLQLSVFIPALAGLFIAARLLTDYVQLRLWLRGDQPLVNDMFNISMPAASPVMASLIAPISASVEAISGTIDIGTITAFIRIVTGHLFSMTVFTGGMVLFLIIVLLSVMFCLLRRKKRSEALQYISNNMEITLVTVFVVSLLAATTVLTAAREASWHIDSITRDLKWLVYSRYWAVTVAPAIMVSAAILKKPGVSKWVYCAVPLLSVGICAFFIRVVAPYLAGFQWSVIFHEFRAIPLRGLTDILYYNDFILVSVVCLILITLVFLLFRYNKALIALSCVLVFFMFHNFYITAVVMRENSISVERENMKVVNFFNTAGITEAEHYDILVDLPLSGNLHLQFYLYNHRLVPINHPRGIGSDVESSILVLRELPNADSDIVKEDYLSVYYHVDVLDDTGPFILVAKNDEQLTRRLLEKSFTLFEVIDE